MSSIDPNGYVSRKRPGVSPVHLAAQNKRYDSLVLLLDRGCPVNTQTETQKTPLHYAVLTERNQPVITLLLSRGAAISSPDKNKQTPLHYAARSGHVEAIRILVNGGSPIEQRDKWQRTPLHWAILNNHPEAVTCLIDMGASACPGSAPIRVHRRLTSNVNHSPLHLALQTAQNIKDKEFTILKILLNSIQNPKSVQVKAQVKNIEISYFF